MIGLIDSNVLVYAYNKASPFHRIANEFITDIIRTQKRACVSELNLYEFYSVITDTRKVERSLSPKEAAEIIKRMIKSETIKVLYCDKRAIEQLSELSVEHSIKRYHIYDLVIASVMRVNGIKKIITANEDDFKPFDFIEIENPFAEIIKSLKIKEKSCFISYGRQWLEEDDIEAVVNVLRSDWLTQGPKIEEFERKIAEYCGAKFAVAVSNGTAALHIACLTAGIGKGDEVITSPITFVASANCILYCGGKPVFADIQEDTINIDPEKIKEKIRNPRPFTGESQKSEIRNLKAIIPVHFAGHPCDLEEISHIASKNNLIVIEDACHALGAEYRLDPKSASFHWRKPEIRNPKWIKIGSCQYSDMTVFSFHPVKHITTCEGGAVLTNNRELYEKLLVFRNHGITKEKTKLINKNDGDWYYEMQELGFNYRITDFQCALGISQLKKLDKFIERRREITDIYNQELAKVDEIILPQERPYVKSSWHIYFIRLKNPAKRKQVFEKLQKSGIGVQVHYIPIHLQPYYQERFGYKEGSYPKAEKYYEEAITLPLYPKMTDDEVNHVIQNFVEILKMD